MIDVLLSAFLLSVVLLGIHSYYGLHIIERGIIFTDLAIGQMAALGAAVAILLFHDEYTYPVSLAFALAGALVIAFMMKRSKSLEAFIGLLFAFGMSAAVIVLSRSPHGAEDLQKLMAADILFVPIVSVVKTAVLYAVVGLLLFFVLPRLSGIWRDLLFFGSFSVVVTNAVDLAGVLVVFAVLVAPAFVVSAFEWSFRTRLLAAWGIGTVLNFVAITSSYF
ncbi:MAG: metal ABC transporter permease, partial [Verrucomicrobia bacterium]|nr:metal ABC transporter permease [Verrucomicrobiota bacterium]